MLVNAEIKESKKTLVGLPDDCVIVDIETTGFSPLNDSIIEVCALKIKNNEIIEEFSSLVKPLKEIPKFITKLTGITPEMVENAPLCIEVLNNFCGFVQNYPIVGHNIRFDLSFINKKLNRVLKNESYDTITYSKKVYTELESYKLTNIAKFLNIDTNNAHRALKDCYMTYQIMMDIKSKFDKLD